VDATEANVAEYDLLIYKTNEDDGSWELLKSDDEEYHITASRVEHGDFFISEAGIAGDIWMSDGSEAGAWWKAGMYLTTGNDTLNVNVGTAANQVVALNAEAKLPAVDASLLVGLTAEQINVVGGEPSVTNEEFNALGDLRLESTDETEAEDNWRLTYGIVQDQLDDKQNGNANLDDLADGELTYDKVEFGEFFIKQAGDDEKVWTWVGTEADGVGSWILPPGAQRLNSLMDASTMPLTGEESSDNVFIGEGSGHTIDIGSGNGNLNTALGRNALASLQEGNINVAIGKDAGQNIVDGNGNILIGFNAGKDLGPNESNKLIINNNNTADGVLYPLIEGDFETGEVLINNSLYATNSLHLGSSADNKFTIEQTEGDITIKSEGDEKKISFVVNGDDDLLTMDYDGVIKLSGETKIASDETNDTYINIDGGGANLNLTGQEDVVVNAADEFRLNGNNISLSGAEIISITNESGQDNKISFVVNDGTELLKMESDEMIKLVGTTKIASDDNSESYINATDSGQILNLKGKEKVLVHAVDENVGVIQLLAEDSVNLTADNIVFTAENEFVVSNNMRVGGNFRISNDDESAELLISYDGNDDFTIANTKVDKDVIFQVESGNVMRLDGTEQALQMTDNRQIQFRNNSNYISSSATSVLDIVAPSLNINAATLTNVSGDLLVGDSLMVGATPNHFSITQEVGGDVFLMNNRVGKDVTIGVYRGGPTRDEVLTIDGLTGHLTVSKKVDIQNDVIAGTNSELRFVNTGLQANDIIAEIISTESETEFNKVTMKKAVHSGAEQGIISFNARINDGDYKFMEINTKYDDPLNDTTITVYKDFEVLGRLYTNSTAFATSITPAVAGQATIGEQTLPWGDLYLYDGNLTPDESAHIYFQNEGELGAPDVTISHDPGLGIRLKDDKQMQFKSANTYIYGSGTNPDEILNLIAPTLTMDKADGTDIQVNVEGNLNPTTLIIGADNNEFTIKENSSVADEILITSAISNKDVVFSTNMGGTANTEVMRIVGANASLRMEGDQMVEFNNANAYIHSSATDQLDLAGNEIVLKTQSGAATIAKVEGTLKANSGLTLYEGATDEFKIYESAASEDDYIIKNETIAKDVVFVADKSMGELDEEVMRVVGADASLRMTGENPVQFSNADHYIKVDVDGDLTPLNIVAQGTNSIIKIGKDGGDAENTDSIAVVGDKVQVRADNFSVKADNRFWFETDDITMMPLTSDEAPALKLLSSKSSVDPLPAELVFERNAGAGSTFEILGKIVGKGQTDPAGETPQEFASILFKSPVVDEAAADGGLRGAIYFKTLNSGLDDETNEPIINLMDINGTVKKQVTIKGDLKVGGAISM
ncbi:uncharacterized protein METZ01_LOCUS90362, partial [marine metagenome]